MCGSVTPSVLQVGFGAFGPVHLQAWLRLVPPGRIWVAEPDAGGVERASRFGIRRQQIVPDIGDALRRVDVVDVLTPTPTHFGIADAALAAGKDVFLEKPATATLGEAERLAARVEASGRVLQVGYFFRHHPLFRWARARVADGALGDLRYLAGTFAGFKRARGDMGVTASDAVHFLDYFTLVAGAPPDRVMAVRRDHFGRGLDDLALILLDYPGGLVGRVEAGLIQPGRHTDLITPGALTTKEVQLCGSEGAIEIDFPAERLTLHRVRHQRQADGLLHPVYDDALSPRLPPSTAVDVLESQFRTFLGHVRERTRPEADILTCGVAMARLLDAIERAAAAPGWTPLASEGAAA